MTLSDYLQLAAMTAGVGLASATITQAVKLVARVVLLWRDQFPEEFVVVVRDGERAEVPNPWRKVWRSAIRSTAALVGLGLGLLPVWPPWLLWWWGPLLGIIGGGSASALIDARDALIAGSPAALLDSFRARFGGKVAVRKVRPARRRPSGLDSTVSPTVSDPEDH